MSRARFLLEFRSHHSPLLSFVAEEKRSEEDASRFYYRTIFLCHKQCISRHKALDFLRLMPTFRGHAKMISSSTEFGPLRDESWRCHWRCERFRVVDKWNCTEVQEEADWSWPAQPMRFGYSLGNKFGPHTVREWTLLVLWFFRAP